MFLPFAEGELDGVARKTFRKNKKTEPANKAIQAGTKLIIVKNNKDAPNKKIVKKRSDTLFFFCKNNPTDKIIIIDANIANPCNDPAVGLNVLACAISKGIINLPQTEQIPITMAIKEERRKRFNNLLMNNEQ